MNSFIFRDITKCSPLVVSEEERNMSWLFICPEDIKTSNNTNPWHRMSPELFPAFYGTQEIHHHLHKNLSLLPIICQTDPVHIPTFYLSKIHFNIIVHLQLALQSGNLLPGFQTKILQAFHIPGKRATCPAHFILLRLLTLLPSITAG
jgi:hypothetical protein